MRIRCDKMGAFITIGAVIGGAAVLSAASLLGAKKAV